MTPTKVADWKSYATDGIRVGAASAPVTIVEFSDFQCPFCKRAATYLDSVRLRHPSDVAIVYRHYPLHRYAIAAAQLAECANSRGVFWPVQLALFNGADSIGTRPWASYARAGGMPDTTDLSDCMSQSWVSARLRTDSIAADRLGVTGTPTFVINETRVPGFPGDTVLDRYVDAALRSARH